MFENIIIDLTKKLLREKVIDLVIGYGSAQLPFRTKPIVINQEDQADALVWNPFCGHNLARYLKYYKNTQHKIALMVKGCDSRAVQVLLKEDQIKRERLYLIGLPCPGLVNREKLQKQFPQALPEDFQWKEAGWFFRGKQIDPGLLLEETCLRCRYPNPLIYDELIGEPQTMSPYQTYQKDYLCQIDALSPEERWDRWLQEMTKCIRCYACRNSCPLCYCQECFTDSTQPQWISPAPTPSDNFLFHLARTMHMAGRCVECGACERACPVSIPIAQLPLKVEAIIREQFQFEAGTDQESTAPLLTYRENDPGDFIK
ncbi:MAG: 4Fe-4S ferredoxin [Candidatus Atribacteria bacterium]|nr:4Fe-4S ferredoxin [Candidatus Atribacteria bacterium]